MTSVRWQQDEAGRWGESGHILVSTVNSKRQGEWLIREKTAMTGWQCGYKQQELSNSIMSPGIFHAQVSLILFSKGLQIKLVCSQMFIHMFWSLKFMTFASHPIVDYVVQFLHFECESAVVWNWHELNWL